MSPLASAAMLLWGAAAAAEVPRAAESDSDNAAAEQAPPPPNIVRVPIVPGGAPPAPPSEPSVPPGEPSGRAGVRELLPPGEPPPLPEPQPDPEPEGEDAAWLAYHEAVLAMLAGRNESARRRLEQLRRDYPLHPAALYARELLDRLPEPTRIDEPPVARRRRRPRAAEPHPDPEPPDGARRERMHGGARAELVLGQTLFGIAAGVELCIAFQCRDERSGILALGAGGGGALFSAIYGSKGGVTPGGALLVNTGTGWGMWHGLALAGALDFDGEGMAASMLLGQVVGTGLGAFAGGGAPPTAGQVSMVNSAGIWAGVIMFLSHGATDYSAQGSSIWWSLLAASDLGAAAAALLARDYPTSRGRVLVIDAGGILGMLAAMSLVVVADDNPSDSAMFGAAIAGSLAGLGWTTYLTRNWDAGELPLRVWAAPRERGATAGLAWDF